MDTVFQNLFQDGIADVSGTGRKGRSVRKQATRPTGSIDRRVARTRALLQQAHLSLIVEKGYDATTVEDICAAANVGRSTFYAHYADKQDLHRRGLETLRRELVERSTAMLQSADGDRATGFGFSLPMFEHARDHLPLYRALVGTPGAAIAMDAIRQILCDIVRAQMPPDALGSGALPREFAAQYLVGAYLAVLTWWLDQGAKSSPEAMDAMFQRLAAGGLTAATPTGSGAGPARVDLGRGHGGEVPAARAHCSADAT